MCSVAVVGGAISESGRSKIVFHNCISHTKHKFCEFSPKLGERKLSPSRPATSPTHSICMALGNIQYLITAGGQHWYTHSHTPTRFMEWYILMQVCSNICSFNFVCEVECALMQICGPTATEETAHRSKSTNDVRIAYRELETIFLLCSSNPLG